MKKIVLALLILANLAAATVLHADCYVPDPANPGAWKWQPSCGSTPISYGQSVVTAGKVFTVQSTLTLLGNDGASLNIGAGGTLGALAFLTVDPIANGGTGQTTQQAAINALTGTQGAGKYLWSDGTNAGLSLLQASDITTALGASTYDPYGAASTVQGNLNTHAAATTGVHGAGAYTLLNSGNIGSTVQGYNTNTAIGPGSSATGHVAVFSSTDGKTLADGGAPGVAPVSSTKTGNYTVQNSDFPGSLTMNCSTTCTLTLPAVASIGSRGILKVTSIGAGALSYALPVSTYLWGTSSGFGLNTSVIGTASDWWTDGTNWYASPVNIGIAYSLNNALSGGNQTSWHSLDISALVPVSAKNITGVLLSASGLYAYMSNTSSGYNAVPSGGGSFAQFTNYPLLTPQTLWYQNSSSGTTGITITGFGF